MAGGTRDYYAVLGVPPSASMQEIGFAFRARAKALHPDVNPAPDSERQFQQLVDAHDVLGDADRRREYDQRRLGQYVPPTSAPYVPPKPTDAPSANCNVAPMAAAHRYRKRRRFPILFLVAMVVLAAALAAKFFFDHQSNPISSGWAVTTGTRIDVNGQRRLYFTTPDGQVYTDYDWTFCNDCAVGSKVKIEYYKADPRYAFKYVHHFSVPLPPEWMIGGVFLLVGLLRAGMSTRRRAIIGSHYWD